MPMIPPPSDSASRQALRPGHWRCLEQLAQAEAYAETRRLYSKGLGEHGVYLRPTGMGFTVLSLDHTRCRSMVGVGARSTKQHCLLRLPPSSAHVAAALAGYHQKVESLGRGSIEECYALQLMARAFVTGMSLPWPGTFFVHQEWKLPSGRKLDLLGVDPRAGSLVVIELKESHNAAQQRDLGKGGTALEQAQAYAIELHQFRAQLYPFFEGLARTLGNHHGSRAAFAHFALDPEHVPQARVSWPGERTVA